MLLGSSRIDGLNLDIHKSDFKSDILIFYLRSNYYDHGEIR